ncbi:metallophosphoesterase [Chitinasiproducens palmae]|uniref:Calcineurin-like phosphoesterase domain-containing protein n=1 Tax=Chitinasiproducens palmae TaxID=1770053 RepID=A0A1H2PQD2_9BURK|nr:metallophosphoesterase [Chitinasiproducens palmae]SDV48582.1 hypothetical protein SAMN05216551_105208 [Chitinasiproducens palmae]
MRRAFLYRIVLIGTVLHFYVGIRLIPALFDSGPVRTLAWLYLLISLVTIPLGARGRSFARTPARLGVVITGLVAMGCFSTLLLLTFARDLFLLLAAGWDFLTGADWLSRVETSSATAVLLLTAALSMWALYCARRAPPIRRVRIPIEGLPPGFEGFSIAQISDLHVGPTIRRPYVERVVKAVNALGADVVAFTGDAIDGSVAQLASDTAPLSKLHAREGVFFVTGNHEYYSGAAPWIARFRELGMRVLLNEHVVLSRGTDELILAGITDYSAGHFNPVDASDPVKALSGGPDTTAILLAHQPLSAPAAARAGFSLQISGHTHGGQLFPWNFVVKVQQPFVAGLDRVDGMLVYISRGTGYWGPPMRLFAPSEITLLILSRA